jgi:hypothetical protein
VNQHPLPQREYGNDLVPQSAFGIDPGTEIYWVESKTFVWSGLVRGFRISFKKSHRDEVTFIIEHSSGLIEKTFPAYDKTKCWVSRADARD